MKKFIGLLILSLALVFAVCPVVLAADAQIAQRDPEVQSIRHAYFTGSSAVNSSVSVPTSGTEVWDVISIEVHLSAAGGAGDLTVTKDSGLGAAYDTVLLTQDMTSVTDLFQTYSEGEVVLQNTDDLDIVWANGSGRTYGITVKYKLR